MEQKEEVIERLLRQLESTIQTGKEKWESPEVQAKVEDLRSLLRKWLKEYPVGTLAVSVVSGFVLAKLLGVGRSRKRFEE